MIDDATMNQGWVEVQKAEPTPFEFVLVFVKFSEEGVRPRIFMAFYDVHDKYWRWEGGRLKGVVTHWMALPPAPIELKGHNE